MIIYVCDLCKERVPGVVSLVKIKATNCQPEQNMECCHDCWAEFYKTIVRLRKDGP